MKNILKRIDKKVLAFSVTGFALFFALALLFPYSGDDWAWGSSIGIERLECWFSNYNGRYAGNLLVLLLTRSKILSAAFISSSVILSGIICYASLKNKKAVSLLFFTLILLLVSRPIFSQSLVWTSGYSNYVPSILMTFICIYLMQNIFEKKKPVYPKYYAPFLLITAFVSSLFMETVTLLNICLGFLIIAYTLIKFKRLYLTHVFFLAGSVTGAMYMFSNEAYLHIANNEDGYRETALSGELIDFIESVFGHANYIFNGFVLDNLFLFSVLSVLCIAIGIIHTKTSKAKITCVISYFCSAVNAVTLILLIAKKNNGFWRLVTVFLNPDYIGHFMLYAVCAIFILSLSVQIIVCIKNKSIRDKLILYIISTVLLIIPLFFVTPIGPRCYFAPYLMLDITAVTLFNYAVNEYKISKKALRHVSTVMLAGLLSVMLFLFTVFIPVNHYSKLRDEYVIAQSQLEDRKNIFVCKVPYSDFVWTGNPASSELLRERYLLFNNIDTNAKLVIKEYDEFEAWAKRFNKKTGYSPKQKLRNTKSRFYRDESEKEQKKIND